jgi:ADP-ribose pyrophosphatase
MSDFRLVFSKPVLETKIFDVTHDRAEHASGAALDRHVVVNAPSAVMCARKPNGDVLLVRQFRLPPRQALWELPAGRCDKGEPVLETAKRELIEETGYRARKWSKVTEFYPAPAIATELMTVFLAEDLTEGASEPEDYELIETRWTPWTDALAMVRKGEIRDAKTIASLLYVQAFC